MFVVKVPCSWFVILSAVHAAAIQQNPQTRVRLAGGSLVLLCPVGNGTTVVWDFTPPTDTTKSVMIASSRNQSANSRYKVDCNMPGTCRLIITEIRQTDAGLYRCLGRTDAQSTPVKRPPVDLTVLAAVPTCTTLMSDKTAYLSDDLIIRCKVNYSGNERPLIHCQELSGNIRPSPATLVDTGNSSHHSLIFTYDIIVDRITKKTMVECVTSVNMKDFPHGHVQYTWRWQSDIKGEVETQSASNPPVSTTTTTSGDASPSSPIQGQFVVGILVATFVIFMLVVIFVLYRLVMKGVTCSSSRDQRCCSPGTTLSASISAHGQTFERPAELYSISDDNEGPVPPVPSRSQSSRDNPLVAEREMQATGCQVMSNVVLQHVNNNEFNENTPSVSVNPTYAELSVSFRTDRTHRPTRPTDTSRAVYADINHLIQTNSGKTTKR